MHANSILVVDDDQQLRELMQISLENAGYRVAGADDGRKASQVMTRQAFDVVITDLLMPECDGLELIEKVRRRYPEMRIIAMSGGGRVAREEYLRIAKGFGAHRMLEKPFDQKQLLGAIQDVLTRPIVPRPAS